MSTQSWTPPTAEQLNQVVAAVVRPEQRRHFFDNLQNPLWVKPLADRGFFNDPPDPIRDDEAGTIAFPSWPESRYLSRMAASAPADVAAVIRSIRQTENARVHEDFLDALLVMPPETAATFARDIARWMTQPNWLLVPDKVGRLITQLSKGGQPRAALRIARNTLRLIPDPRPAIAPEPAPRFSEWEYGEIVRRDIPALIAATGVDGLRMLCNVLDSAIKLSLRSDEHEPPEDYSYIWRGAIEDHAQNGPGGVKSLLVSAVRDAALTIVQSDSGSLNAVVSTLEGFSWNAFRRIALYIVAERLDVSVDLVRTHVLDRTAFSSGPLRHEYAALLAKSFGKLLPHEQDMILEWINQGPDKDFLRLRFQSEQGIDEQAVAQYVRVWTRDRLSWIADALPADWAKRYRELVAAFGAPEHADFVNWTSGLLTGPNSPKTAAELNSIAAIEVVRFLRRWRPEDDEFMGPSREGLGRQLAAAIAEEPARYALVATNFNGLDPTYVRSLITGLKDALTKQKSFEWPPVLALCRLVVESPWQIEPGESHLLERDVSWSPTHQAMAELLSAAFDVNIPIDLRPGVWSVLQRLTQDPDPTPADEEKYGGSNMDPLTHSINSARGAAMHAVVRYALWVHRAIQRDHAAANVESTFEQIPEVRELLQLHLNTLEDPALAIRAVYGQWLPWLALLDSQWVATHLDEILPPDPASRLYWDAAWETYIFYSQLYDSVFELLRRQYEFAVERIGTTNPDMKHRSDPDGRLGEHLMVMYWRGNVSLAKGDLVHEFFERAGPKAREHALGFVGRTARGTEGSLETEVRERLVALWQSRMSAAQHADDPSAHARELAAFGWWFTSGKFESGWGLAQLEAALRIGDWPEADQWIVEALARLAQNPAFLSTVIECLSLLVHADREGWHTYGWREEAKQILLRGAASDDQQIKNASVELANWLGANRGLADFRDVIRAADETY